MECTDATMVGEPCPPNRSRQQPPGCSTMSRDIASGRNVGAAVGAGVGSVAGEGVGAAVGSDVHGAHKGTGLGLVVVGAAEVGAGLGARVPAASAGNSDGGRLGCWVGTAVINTGAELGAAVATDGCSVTMTVVTVWRTQWHLESPEE